MFGKVKSVGKGQKDTPGKINVHIFQHAPFEDIGCIALWLHKIGANVSYTRFFENTDLPQLKVLDLIIIMGGPISANDESVLPWLRAEKKFIRDAVNSGVAILGVCLGAQIIASALGARVYRNSKKEIGWLSVEATPHDINAFCFPDKFIVFQWHGETFEFPRGAVQLARSEACENQAFQVGRNVIGLQFHLETTPESLCAILDNCGNELAPGPYIQPESELRGADSAIFAQINGIMDKILSYMLGVI